MSEEQDERDALGRLVRRTDFVAEPGESYSCYGPLTVTFPSQCGKPIQIYCAQPPVSIARPDRIALDFTQDHDD